MKAHDEAVIGMELTIETVRKEFEGLYSEAMAGFTLGPKDDYNKGYNAGRADVARLARQYARGEGLFQDRGAANGK